MELESDMSLDSLEVWDKDKKCDCVFWNADKKWIMRIKLHGQIEFNREGFPDLTPDKFAEEVISILETLQIKK